MDYLEVSRPEADFVIRNLNELKDVDAGLDAIVIQMDTMHLLSSRGCQKVLRKDSFYEFNLDVLKKWMLREQGTFPYQALFDYSEKNNARIYSVEERAVELYETSEEEGKTVKTLNNNSRFNLWNKIRGGVANIPVPNIPKPEIKIIPESAKESLDKVISGIREKIPGRFRPAKEEPVDNAPYRFSNAMDAEKIITIVVPRVCRLMHAQNVTRKPRIGIFYPEKRLEIADYLREDEKRKKVIQKRASISQSSDMESGLEYYFDGSKWYLMPVTIDPFFLFRM